MAQVLTKEYELEERVTVVKFLGISPHSLVALELANERLETKVPHHLKVYHQAIPVVIIRCEHVVSRGWVYVYLWAGVRMFVGADPPVKMKHSRYTEH